MPGERYPRGDRPDDHRPGLLRLGGELHPVWPRPVPRGRRLPACEFLYAVSFRQGRRRSRLVPTRANGQPAFGRYLRDPHTPVSHAHGMLVLTIAGDRVRVITGFADNSVLARFGLPRTLPD
jgi:hypothetical protein